MAITNEDDSIYREQSKGSTNTLYDPDNFRIEAVKEEDYELYFSFMADHFLPREPLSRGLHLAENDFRRYFGKRIKSWIGSGTSVYAIHIPTNELAGVMFTQILTRETSELFGMDGMEHSNESVRNFMKVLLHLERSVNLFEDAEVEKILEIVATTVHPKFAGNMLTSRITEESEKLAIEVGCQMVTSQSTNVITQQIRTKMGYEVCYTLDYATFELDGKRVLDLNAMNNETTIVKVLKKYLNIHQ